MTNKVLILHGWGDDSSKGFIPELVKNLKDKNYSPIAIDLPNTQIPKFEEWFKFAEKEIEKFKDEKINIVGHSMGGLLGLKLAEKHKINRLILVAPVGSKPSDKYFDSMSKNLSKEELEVYKKYQQRDIDIEKIKSNSKEIIFVFGKKDSWVNEEIRNFYTEKFKDSAKFNVLEDEGHMSESEGVKRLSVVEDLFDLKKPAEAKKEEAEEKPKEVVKITEKPKKTEAVVRGDNIPISTKYSAAICRFIKNKRIEDALSDLEQVMRLKKAIPMKGEIPHRKGKGIMSGKFPQRAVSHFIILLKSLAANSNHNGLENPLITEAVANIGERPYGRFGRVRKKRSHIRITAKNKKIKEAKSKKRNAGEDTSHVKKTGEKK